MNQELATTSSKIHFILWIQVNGEKMDNFFAYVYINKEENNAFDGLDSLFFFFASSSSPHKIYRLLHGCNHIEWLVSITVLDGKALTKNSNYLLFSQVETHHGFNRPNNVHWTLNAADEESNSSTEKFRRAKEKKKQRPKWMQAAKWKTNKLPFLSIINSDIFNIFASRFGSSSATRKKRNLYKEWRREKKRRRKTLKCNENCMAFWTW